MDLGSDGNLPPPPDPNFNQVKFAKLKVNAGGKLHLLPFNDSSDPDNPFNGVLYFQRRRNEQPAAIKGQGGLEMLMRGTIYSKWGSFELAGGGRYDAQFVVGSMTISGQATVTLSGTGKNFGRANQIFLVE